MMTLGMFERMKMIIMKKRVNSCFCSLCFFLIICFDSSLKYLQSKGFLLNKHVSLLHQIKFNNLYLQISWKSDWNFPFLH